MKEQEQRNDIVTMLQDGEAFFDVAFGEVKVIVNVSLTVRGICTDVLWLS